MSIETRMHLSLVCPHAKKKNEAPDLNAYPSWKWNCTHKLYTSPDTTATFILRTKETVSSPSYKSSDILCFLTLAISSRVHHDHLTLIKSKPPKHAPLPPPRIVTDWSGGEPPTHSSGVRTEISQELSGIPTPHRTYMCVRSLKKQTKKTSESSERTSAQRFPKISGVRSLLKAWTQNARVANNT